MNIGELVSEKRKSKGCWWQRGLNLVAGCTPVSEACLHCWSAEMAHRQSMRHGISDYQWNLWGGLTTDAGKWSGETRLLEKNLELPKTVKKPTLWSVWNDLFHPDVPFEFIKKFWDMVSECRQHFFLVLTKRPERVLEFTQWMTGADHISIAHWCRNVGLGVTLELFKYLHRVEILLQIPAALHFVSLEPLLGELSLRPHDDFSDKGHGRRLLGTSCNAAKSKGLDWVIMGCESGRKRRPTDLEWFRKVHMECNAAEVPVFLKQYEFEGKVCKGIQRHPDNRYYLNFPEVEWKP